MKHFFINYSNENKIVVDECGEYENEAFKSHCSFLEKDILEGIFNIEKNVVIIVIKKNILISQKCFLLILIILWNINTIAILMKTKK